MSRGEWLSLVGVVVGLLFGIPGIAVLLFDRPTAVASFFIIFAIIVLACGLFGLWWKRSSPWVAVRNDTHLTLHDQAGRDATFIKRLVLRSNRPGQDRYRHRELSFDGSLVSFECSGATVKSSGVEAGDHFVEVIFPRSVGFFGRIETSLTLEIRDGFVKSEEFMGLQVNLPIRHARLSVDFPSDRLPLEGEAFYEDARRRRKIEGVKEGPRRLTLDCPAGLLGLRRGTYFLRWRW